jgi:acyl-CoA dehydrogenase
MDFSLSEELTMIRDMARDFVTNELLPIEREVLVREKGGSRGAPIPADKRARLKRLAVEQGLWAMSAPEALGGGGLSTLGACLVAEELGKTFVDFDFGDVPPILFDANAEQQGKYLAPAISGEKEVLLALLEPDMSDAITFKTRATRAGDGWKLNGAKLVGNADFYLVFAEADEGPTCFIVEGVVTQEGQLVLNDTLVPAANVLGEGGRALELGRKHRNARWLRAAARKVGVAARLLEMSWQYARDWKAMGQALAVRPAVQRYLSEMAIEVDATRWLVYYGACELDEGREGSEAAIRAHLYASEMVQRAVDRATEIYGGPAQAADLPMFRAYAVAVDDKTSEWTCEMQRFQVANNLVNG